MSYKEKYNLTYYPEMMLKYAGLHPHFKSKLSMFYSHPINCFFFIFLLILAVLEVVLSRNIFKAIEGLSSVLLMTYTFCRYITNYYSRPALAHLLHAQSKFWSLENFQDPTRTKCENLMMQASNFIRFYKNYALVLASIFYVQPFIFHELQMKIYVPEGWFYFLYFVYWYMTPPLFVSVYGVTSMFCALCVPATVQLKLVAHRFQNIKTSTERQKLKRLIDYHNFLIKYCKEVNQYASATLFFEYFITISVCCILIFMAANDYPSIDKIKYAGFIVSQFLDTAIYCYSAELISEASLTVGDAVYNSTWYNFNDLCVRKSLVLVVLRSQNKVVFSGFGMVWINMMTFTKVFKGTLSFVSYLNAVATKE